MTEKKSIWGKADSFLTSTRKIIVNGATALVLVVITFSILGGIGSILSGSEKIDTENKILWFKPTGVVVDTEIGVSSSFSLNGLSLNSSFEQHEIKDLLEILSAASNDNNLAAIYVNVSELAMGWSDAILIAEAVKKIKVNGKRVISYAETYTNYGYLIGSQASEVILDKTIGSVSAFGFSRKREYSKEFYENIKLNYHVFTAGDFKSGPETYTRDSMSDEDKLMWNEFANPLWKKMISMIEDGRSLQNGTIQNYGDNFFDLALLTPTLSELALNQGLVDMAMTEEELIAWMFKEFPNKEEDKYQYPDSISIYSYLSKINEDKLENKSKNIIAVVNVEGTIMSGESSYGVAGSDTIISNIRKATENKNVKALIVRVDSGGGSGYATDLINNALAEFKSTGRPIVSSMGNIAASGGVGVTTTSDEIWAMSETLTGSIGAYSVIPTIEGLYEWAGISVDGTSQTKADEWDPREDMPEHVTKYFQSSLDHAYKKFVSEVANNRQMAFEDVLKIAGGRIWTGNKALELGLIDKIGGLDDAIISIAEMAKIDDYKIKTYVKDADPFDVFINGLISNMNIQIDLGPELKMLNKILKEQGKIFDLAKENDVLLYCFVCET